jgi:hypothetical protein
LLSPSILLHTRLQVWLVFYKLDILFLNLRFETPDVQSTKGALK